MKLGMFTEDEQEIRLPHPPLSLRYHLLIEAAVCAAWDLMTNHGREGFNLQTADEDTVTHELYERLYDEVFNKGLVEGFDREIIASVRREPKARNFNGDSLDKMPDLLVDFIDLPPRAMNSQHGLFIECKPVDADHPAGTHYCNKGISRFVCGDYAWAMQSAMMIGYARAAYTVLPKLSEALAARPKEIPSIGRLKQCNHSKASPVSEVVYVSKHGRTFNYTGTSTAAPNIVIRHLWLRRPAANASKP
jgi:hypothetical protein